MYTIQGKICIKLINELHSNFSDPLSKNKYAKQRYKNIYKNKVNNMMEKKGVGKSKIKLRDS